VSFSLFDGFLLLLIRNYKLQITNTKQIPMTKIQNSKPVSLAISYNKMKYVFISNVLIIEY